MIDCQIVELDKIPTHRLVAWRSGNVFHLIYAGPG